MSFGLLIIFIFMVFWRPQEWLFPWMYGWPVLDVVVFASVLGFLIEWDQGKLRIDSSRPQYFLLVGLFIAALMSHLANTYFMGLVNHWMTAFRICFFGILFFSTMTSVGRLRAVCWIFVFMAAFMGIHALLQQSRGYGFGGLPPVMSWRPGLNIRVPRSQFFGIFGDPNDMGQLFATAIPLSFVLFKRRSIFGFALGCGAFWYFLKCIDATWSRGSMIGLAATIGILLVNIFPKRWQMRLLTIGCVGGLLLFPYAGTMMDESAMDRVNFWGEANWAFKPHPLFGVGLGMIREYITHSRAVHNAYVTCYSEIGIFGYFFWFSLLLVSIFGVVRSKIALQGIRHPDAVWLSRFCTWGLAAFAGFCASSYFLSRAFVFPLFFLVAMLSSVPYLAQQYIEDEEAYWPYVDLKADVLKKGIPLSLLSIIYIYISILLLNKLR